MGDVVWNDAEFAEMARSASVHAAVDEAAQAIAANANAIAGGHLGSIEIEAPQGGTFAPASFARPPYAASTRRLTFASVALVRPATEIGRMDQNQFHTLNAASR